MSDILFHVTLGVVVVVILWPRGWGVVQKLSPLGFRKPDRWSGGWNRLVCHVSSPGPMPGLQQP